MEGVQGNVQQLPRTNLGFAQMLAENRDPGCAPLPTPALYYRTDRIVLTAIQSAVVPSTFPGAAC
jgi:hypothetical protein